MVVDDGIGCIGVFVGGKGGIDGDDYFVVVFDVVECVSMGGGVVE